MRMIGFPRRGKTALAQGKHVVRSPGLVEEIFSRPERVLLRGRSWILVEWMGKVMEQVLI